MEISKYFESLTKEIGALKDRVRHYIDDRHWLSDGEWKESVLRSILRRHLPNYVGVGRGFILAPEKTSTQIDILLYNKSKPILFQDGDFLLITPDAVLGAIEVKSRIKKDIFKTVLNKHADVVELVHNSINTFFGIFIYENTNIEMKSILNDLKEIAAGKPYRIINCISCGDSKFIRFWEFSPENSKRKVDKWHAYQLKNKAPAYFVHNVVDHLCPQWTYVNNEIWYPKEGKEDYKVTEISLKKT